MSEEHVSDEWKLIEYLSSGRNKKLSWLMDVFETYSMNFSDIQWKKLLKLLEWNQCQFEIKEDQKPI